MVRPFKDFETPLRRPLEPSGLVAQVTLTNGLPYLVYYDSSRSVLRHVPALELTGSSWQAPNTYNEVVDGGNNVGLGTAVIVHRGGVGVAYHDSTAGDLKYVHYDGATWSSPVRVDTAGNAGFKPSLALINGLPAIAYYADIEGGSLRYVRANTIEGNSWGTPLTVANGGVQPGAILRELNSKPAIAFRRFVSGSSSMRFVGALDASGNTWSAEVTVANNIDSLESGFAVVNGRPAMSFQQNFRLHYSRALNAEGSTWATPVLLDATSEFSGELSSLAVIGGRPAVAYMGAPTTLFTRAVDADGTSWGSPVVVDPSNFALLSLQLIEVDGKPGIGFRRDPVTQPQFQRAISAEGTQWDVPVPIEAVGTSGAYLSLNADGNQIAASYYEPSEGALRVSRSLNQGLTWLEPSVPDGGGVGQFVSAAVVNGLPAVAYYDGNSGDLKYKRSVLVGGQIMWSSSATKILDTLGDAGLYPSLAVLNNQLPAVAYYDFSAGDLKFVRATDVNGAFWENPVVLASTGDVGRHASMVTLQGKPAIAYYDADNGALKFILANDAQGVSWGAPITVDSGANVRDVGMFASLAVVNGRPAIVYRDATTDRLLYVRANDALGATWPTAFPLGEHGGNHGVLRVINDRPVVAYVTKSLTMIVAATDLNGGNWARQFVAVPNSDVYSVALTDLNNNPSLTLLESRGVRNLYPIRRFQVNWFAVEP